MKITYDLILKQAQRLHGIALSEERAAELCEEVETINRQTSEAVASLQVEDEPADFERALLDLKDGLK